MTLFIYLHMHLHLHFKLFHFSIRVVVKCTLHVTVFSTHEMNNNYAKSLLWMLLLWKLNNIMCVYCLILIFKTEQKKALMQKWARIGNSDCNWAQKRIEYTLLCILFGQSILDNCWFFEINKYSHHAKKKPTNRIQIKYKTFTACYFISFFRGRNVKGGEMFETG